MEEGYQLIISPEAAADLEAIRAYIARDSEEYARGMVERILTSIEGLKATPHRYVLERQNKKLRFPVRSLPVRPYIVFFRVVEQDRVVRILTIRHGARRRPRRFS